MFFRLLMEPWHTLRRRVHWVHWVHGWHFGMSTQSSLTNLRLSGLSSRLRYCQQI